MIYLGADGYVYDTNDFGFRNNFRNFTVYDEGAGGGQTIEIVGQRDITPDLAAEYARQLQLQQERGQIIGYTPTGEPIYNVVTGDWPPTPGAENTVVVTATTNPPATDETEDGKGGLQTGASGLLGGTPITTVTGTGEGTGVTSTGTGAGGTGTGTGGGLLGDGTTTVVGGTGNDTVVGGTGNDTGTGGTGTDTVTGGGGNDTVVGGGGNDTTVGGGGNDISVVDPIFDPVLDPIILDPILEPEVPPVIPPVVEPPVIPPVTPPVTPPTVTPPTVTPPTTPPPTVTEMMKYGGLNFFGTPISPGFYSERGFEPNFVPFGQYGPGRDAEYMFDRYATQFAEDQAARDFWNSKIQQLGYNEALREFLNPRDVNAPRNQVMFADPDYVFEQSRMAAGFMPPPMLPQPTFRSGVAGYTQMVPTGFQFGVPEVMAPRVVFQPGVFDPGIIGDDGTWRPTPRTTPPGTTPPGGDTGSPRPIIIEPD